jgi:LuxR family maltose regulon positive regulatory protein
MVALALAYQATGRPQEADAMLALLAEYAHTKRDPACLVIAESSRARLALVRGAEQSAVRWARAASPPPPEVMVWWFEIPTLTHCRALLARDSGSGLRELVGRLGEHLKANEAVHNIRQQIDILSLLALAHHKQGQSAGALAALSRAVDLAAPGGWIWPFVEPGQPMAELLRLLPAQRGRVHFVANILAALERVQQDAPAALPTVSADRPRLTEREAAVLPLLARGLSTKQIASELGISVSAAGGRCRSICRKLEAHTRADAVTRARDLGLLPPD